jgi:hypothetical protein
MKKNQHGVLSNFYSHLGGHPVTEVLVATKLAIIAGLMWCSALFALLTPANLGAAPASPIRDCSLTQYGTGAPGTRISACISDLPAAGGVIDLRNLEGVQSIDTPILIDKPARLLLACTEYVISSQIGFIVRQTTTIEGCAGGNGTTITLKNPTATVFSIRANGAFVLENLTIQSAARQTSGAFVWLSGPAPRSDNNRSLIRNVNFRVGWDSIYADETYGLTITDCDFTGFQHAAVVLNHSTNGDQGVININGNKFTGDSTDLRVRGASEAISILSGDGIRIENNYFSTVGVAIHLQWSSDTPNAGQLHVVGNTFESQHVAALLFERQSGRKGTFGGVVINSNFFRSDSADSGDFLKVPDDPSQWLFGLVVTGNLLELGDARTTGINLVGGTGVGDASYIGANRIFGDRGTGIHVGAGFTQTVIGQNYVTGGLKAYNLAIDSTSPGNGVFHAGNHAFGYVTPGPSLKDPINLPNDGYVTGRDATNSKWRRLIGLDTSNRVRISPDGETINLGGPIDNVTVTGPVSAVSYRTSGNCSSGASPALCGSATSGSSGIPAGMRTIEVNTTGVTSSSVILITPDSSIGSKLGVDCDAAAAAQSHSVEARTPGKGFVITIPSPALKGSSCVNWFIVN